MAYLYSAQNHDWDLTLHAAFQIIDAGIVEDRKPRTGNLPMGFSFFVGGMVMAFTAIESYSASVAFLMDKEPRFSPFSFRDYRSKRRFWDKMEALMHAAGIVIDKSSGVFREINEMQAWRNLVTHSSPYEIEPTEIQDPSGASPALHRKLRHLDYTNNANEKQARRFYAAALAYIDLVESRTGLDPKAGATYQAL